MASLPLVYVHGAGPQAPIADLKHETDLLIFGKDMPSTRVGYYANVRWPARRAAVRCGRRAHEPGPRSRAIRAAMAPEITAGAAASAIVAATLTAPARVAAVPPPPRSPVPADATARPPGPSSRSSSGRPTGSRIGRPRRASRGTG